MAIGHKNRKEANHIILDVLITHCSSYLFRYGEILYSYISIVVLGYDHYIFVTYAALIVPMSIFIATMVAETGRHRPHFVDHPGRVPQPVEQ